MIQSLETVENPRRKATEKTIRDFGIIPGRVKTGKRNTITDVPGVLVGHCTVNTEENHTGVTVIIPGPDNAFANIRRQLMSTMDLEKVPVWYR